MSLHSYPIERGGRKCVTIESGSVPRYGYGSVRFDGVPLGSFVNKDDFEAGRSWKLPDGSTLLVQLRRGIHSELHVERDGVPLPGSPGDPVRQLRAMLGLVISLALGHVGVSVLFYSMPSVDLPASMQNQLMLYQAAPLAVGALYACFAPAIARANSRAILVVTVLFSIEIIGGVAYFLTSGRRAEAGIGNFHLHFVLLALLWIPWRAWRASLALERSTRARESSA